MTEIKLAHFLEHSFKAFPDKKALCYQNKEYTYSDVYFGVARLITLLQQHQITTGSRVAFLFANSPELIYFYYACFRLGAVAIPMNPRYQVSEINHIVIDSNPDIIIYHPSFSDLVVRAKETNRLKKCIPFDILNSQEPDSPDLFHSDFEDTQSAVIFYTSGSTAQAKGVVHTHNSLTLNTWNHIQEMSYTSADISLICLPLSISFPFCHQVLTTFATGGCIYLLERFHPELTVNLLATKGITKIYGPPIVYTKVIEEIEKSSKSFSHCLNTAVVAGDTVTEKLHAQFNVHFSMMLQEGIGMTETLFYAMNPNVDASKLGSLGTSIKDVFVKILNNEGLEQPPGSVGEIAICTPMIMSHYLNNPLATDHVFTKDGYLISGDLGCLDSDGYLWFHGRKKQLIVRGGMNISPLEIEMALYKNNYVSEAAVIGIPDPLWGEIVISFVVFNGFAPQITEQTLHAELQQYMADYKIPAKIFIVDSLPKTNTFKIDRLALKAQAMRQLQVELYD